MKKKNLLVIILAIIFIALALVINRYAKAEVSVSDVITKLSSSVNTGLFYNLNDSQLRFTSTIKALGYKGVNLNLGFATPNIALASLGYEIIRLEKLGIEIPLLKDVVIDAGWSLGLKKLFNDNEWVNGPSVTLKVKW